MRNLSLWTSITLALFLLQGCNSEDSAEAVAVPPEQIAAIVNGEVIKKEDITHFKLARGNPQIDDEKVVEEMVATELLRQAAVEAGIADRADVQYQIKLQESELLARLLMRDRFSGKTFTDEELKAHYEEQNSGDAGREYKARHILVKTEDEASAIIEALRAGTDFVELAKERSTGPSGPNGGDLGWFQAASMVAPFADAIKAMGKGDVSVSPVQTQFGWHVIKLEDTREPQKPDFESVREQVEQSLIRQSINSYITEIKDAATIDIK